MTKLARDFAIGASLANLMLIRLWAELFSVANRDAYYLKVGARELLAAPLVVIAAGAVIALLASARRWGGNPGRLAAQLGLAAALFVLFSNIGPLKAPGLLVVAKLWREGRVLNFAFFVAAGIALVIAAAWWRERVSRTVATALLVLSPFALLNAGRAVWYVATLDPDVTFASRVPALDEGPDAPPGPRVIVLLFDAMGRGLSVEHRPPGLAMPALDRLRAEALDAENVTQAGARTKLAVPGLLTGNHVESARVNGPDELRLVLSDGRKPRWDELDNLFRDARRLGGRATVAGWYHPYCRILDEDLSGCAWQPSPTSGGRAREAGMIGAMVDAGASAFPYTVYRRRHLQTWQALLDDATRAVTRPGKGFTFVHLNVPHHPYVYDRETGKLTVLNMVPEGYVDGLAHADLTLAMIREEMERAGTWETSAVLVTSDHASPRASRNFKIRDKEVPAILKMPGDSSAVRYERPFEATQLHGLLQAALRGEVTTNQEAAEWLDGRQAPVPVGAKAP